jgi:integrase
MEPRNVNRRFEQLRSKAGLDWLHLHDPRHAFATFLLDQGEEPRTVMELLGHSTIPDDGRHLRPRGPVAGQERRQRHRPRTWPP